MNRIKYYFCILICLTVLLSGCTATRLAVEGVIDDEGVIGRYRLDNSICALAAHPNEKYIAVGGLATSGKYINEGRKDIIDIETGKKIKTIFNSDVGSRFKYKMAFSHDGKYLITNEGISLKSRIKPEPGGGKNGKLVLYDTQSWNISKILWNDRSGCENFSLSPTNGRIAFATMDFHPRKHYAVIYDDVEKNMTPTTCKINSTTFSLMNNGDNLLILDYEDKQPPQHITILDTVSCKEVRRIMTRESHAGSGQLALYEGNDRSLVAFIAFGKRWRFSHDIVVWDLNREVKLTEIICSFNKNKIDQIYCTSFSPDGHYLVAIIGFDVFVWDTQTWKLLGRLTQHPKALGHTSLAFTPSGRKLIVASSDYITVWDFPSAVKKLKEKSKSNNKEGK